MVNWLKLRLSNEAFYAASAFPVMQLLVTYGYSGNVDLANLLLSSPGSIPVLPHESSFARIATINNPDLR